MTKFVFLKGLLTPSRPGTPMPTNCRELRTLGHIHTGFYMVRGSITNVQTIYCDFAQTNPDSKFLIQFLLEFNFHNMNFVYRLSNYDGI